MPEATPPRAARPRRRARRSPRGSARGHRSPGRSRSTARPLSHRPCSCPVTATWPARGRTPRGWPGRARTAARRRTARPPSCPACRGRNRLAPPLWGLSQTMRWHSRARPLHRRLQQLGVAAVETVGADHHDRRRGSARAGPSRRTNSSRQTRRSACRPPSPHRRCGPVEGLVGTPVLELAGDPGQPGAEAEHLDAVGGAGRGVGELQRGCASSRPSSRTRRGSAPAAGAAAGAGAGAGRRARRAAASTRGRYGAGRACARPGSDRSGGTAARRSQPHGAHDPPQRGELLGRAGREALGLAPWTPSPRRTPSSACCLLLLLAEPLGLRRSPAWRSASARATAANGRGAGRGLRRRRGSRRTNARW